MNAKGIRILDKINRVVCVEFFDILEEIHDGNSFYWSILYSDASGDLGEGKFFSIFEEQANDSENGLLMTWDELNFLSQKLYDIMDIVVIGCKDKNLLHRYENDQEMFETCDIVIKMVDCGFWQIFSNDEDLINRLAKKFKDTKFLTSDYKK